MSNDTTKATGLVARSVPKAVFTTRYDAERGALLRLLAVRLAQQTGDRSFVEKDSRIVEHALDRLLESEGLVET